MSAWKKKDKEITPEEAIEQATEAAIPYWFKSSPLFATSSEGNTFTLHTLDKEFKDFYWIFFVFDPSDVSYQVVESYYKEWLKRFKTFDVKVCLIVRSSVSVFQEKELVDKFVDTNKIMIPLVIDHDGSLSKALNVQSVPKALFLKGEDLFFESTGDNWLNSLEPVIHEVLRKEDPGLPLHPPFLPENPIPANKHTIQLNKENQNQFITLDESWVKDSDPFTNLDIIEGKIGLYGKWEIEDNLIQTSDPKAKLFFVSQKTNFAVLGQSMSKMAEPAKAFIEINDRPVYDVFSNSDLKYDDEGFSVCGLKEPRLYYPIKDLDNKTRNVAMSFMNAGRISIGIYAFEFFDLKVIS